MVGWGEPRPRPSSWRAARRRYLIDRKAKDKCSSLMAKKTNTNTLSILFFTPAAKRSAVSFLSVR
jgi:hypothetical protein